MLTSILALLKFLPWIIGLLGIGAAGVSHVNVRREKSKRLTAEEDAARSNAMLRNVARVHEDLAASHDKHRKELEALTSEDAGQSPFKKPW